MTSHNQTHTEQHWLLISMQPHKSVVCDSVESIVQSTGPTNIPSNIQLKLCSTEDNLKLVANKGLSYVAGLAELIWS